MIYQPFCLEKICHLLDKSQEKCYFFLEGDNMIIKEIKDLRYLSWSKTRQSSGIAGSYLKSYGFSSGKKVYYKLSYFDKENNLFGYEAINEIIAGRIMDILSYQHLEYNLIHALINIDGKEYETYLNSSLDFKEKGESKITLENYYSLNKYDNEDILSFVKRIGFIEDIYKMIIIDFLINNRDRHGANIELIYNNKTKKLRFAPLYDQGLSFLSPYYKKEDILKYNPKEEKKANSYIGSSDLKNNLNYVPKEYLPNIKLDYDYVFKDLEDIVDNIYLTKAKELLIDRWEKLEDIRNKK